MKPCANVNGSDHQEHPIHAIHVFSSGWGEQHKEHRFGTSKPQLWWVLTSQSWVRSPINYFLIEHRDGLILFDTGMDPAIVTDPNYIDSAIGRFLLRRIFRLHISEADRLDRALARSGFQASDIRTAVVSHLHFDHVGGIAHIPQAELLVSVQEWALLSTAHPEREWVLREHIQIPNAKWHPIRFDPTDDPLFAGFAGIFDIAGDGSLILLPTPGHTPGSMSMLVRREGWAPILLVGDLAYETGLLRSGTVPGTGDAEQLRATYATVQQFAEKMPGLITVAAHDPAAAQSINRAMDLPAKPQ